MTEAVVNKKDTRCLFINNGDDLLTLKQVVSKKTDKDDEKQKLDKSVETNGSELNGNHDKTDDIKFDVDNTSSLEPNLEMDSDTDHNITIDSICTHEDRESETIGSICTQDQESETIDNSNGNSNEEDVKNGEKDIQVNSIKCPVVPYPPSGSVYDNDSRDSEDNFSDNIRSPASYFNISARAPLRSYKDSDTTLEDEMLILENEVLNIKRKRKFQDLARQEQKSTKKIKLWNLMKYPFQNMTRHGTSLSEGNSNISVAEIIVETENSIEPESANAITEENNTQNNIEANEEIDGTSINLNRLKNLCNIL